MVPSGNVFVILLHFAALVLFLLASYRVSIRAGEGRRTRAWHLGWMGMAVLTLATILMDFKVV